MYLFNKVKVGISSAVAMAAVVLFASCEHAEAGYPSYDASKPIVCESFYPTGGPIATKVILTGSNFGNNADAVSVFFNQKEAPVIGASGDRLLVLAPKLPGENVVIKVRIGDQEASFPGHFDYKIQTNVTTVCGGDAAATANPTGTISLSEAQFASEMNQCRLPTGWSRLRCGKAVLSAG